MRRRINNLANGSFEYEKPSILLSENRLELEVIEGQNAKGSFRIQSTNDVRMRGIIYTSHARMECLTPQFDGTDVQIQYEFHSDGLIEGNIQKGEFYIISNQNEYNLSFVVSVSKLYADSSMGKIKTLYDFTKLAAVSQKEAFDIFASSKFTNLFKSSEKKERLLYDALMQGGATYQKMEEFLIGTKQKLKVELTASEEDVVYRNVHETVKEGFLLTKNQWGYLEIRIESDNDFLQPTVHRLTTEDFVGSSRKIEYLIDYQKLHAGKNYACLKVRTPYQTICHNVCVEAASNRMRTEEEKQMRALKGTLTEKYLDFRLKKSTSGAWAMETIEILDHFIAVYPDYHWYSLLKAQVLLINKQRQNAEWILDAKKKEILDKQSVDWAYYLYLTTLLIRENRYADRVLKQVEEICRIHDEDERLIWILLFLREDYADNSFRKYQAIKDIVMRGNRSPYFLVEAYYLLTKEPYLLMELGDFECRLLLWVQHQGALCREIAEKVMELAGDCKVFRPAVYTILQGCYQIAPSEEMLTVICAYLIKGQQYDKKYHCWYELGIAHDIRLAGLYEAYAYSMDDTEVGTIPKMVQMYFRYQSNLPYQKKAALYVNIIANKEQHPAVYASYERAMETFALEQLLERHMDDNLAILYTTFLNESMMRPDVAQALSDVLFYHKLTCYEENAVNVCVLHRQLREGRVIPLVNHTAYFPLYSADYVILIEDKYGNRYASGMEYQLVKLMRPGRFLRMAQELAPQCLPFLIYRLDQNPKMENFTDEDYQMMQEFVCSDTISRSYTSSLYPKVIRLSQRLQLPFGDEHELVQINPTSLNQAARKYLIEYFVEMGAFSLAFRWMQMYGIEAIDLLKVMTVASVMASQEGNEDNDYLTYLCSYVFLHGKYDENILAYLCNYYDAATKILGSLWVAAREFELDTYELEERLLEQMLYTTEYLEQASAIFDNYWKNGGKDVLKNAYINYYAHLYFKNDTVLPDNFIPYLIAREKSHAEQIEVCRLAILKYLAYDKEEQANYEELIDEYLKEFVSKDMFFVFYKQFPRFLQEKYGFYDKVFIEHHNEVGVHIYANYRYEEDGDYIKEELEEIYPGIYIKAFILFGRESVQYYISKEKGRESSILESQQLVGTEIFEETDKSRYALINHMIGSHVLRETEKTEAYMKEYHRSDKLCRELFDIL